MDKLEYIPGDLVTNKYYTKVLIVKKTVKNMVYTQNRDAFSDTYLSHKDDVVPMLLTPDILEKNGWKTQNRWYYYLDVAEGFISYIGINFKHKSNKGHLYVEVDGNNMVEIQYCHELQHFLFGLGLSSEMEV